MGISGIANQLNNTKGKFPFLWPVAAITVLGMAASLLLARFWTDDFTLSSGRELVSLYIGPILTVTIAGFFSAFTDIAPQRVCLTCLIAWFLMMLPVLGHGFDRYVYAGKNDPNLYWRAASFMVREKTFCSYDNQLLGVPLGNQYLYQPGYKYYLSLLLLVTGNELIRFVQFFGLFLIVATLVLLIMQLGKIKHSYLKAWPILFFIAITPAMIRNMLLGLTEWLAILMMALSFILLQYKQLTLSLILIALTVFIRQNFLPMALLIAGISIYRNNNRRALPLVMFIATLLLPLAHNYYYAGQWRYFADYSWWSGIAGMTDKAFFYYSMVVPYKQVFLQYAGIDLIYFSMPDLVMALLFIPIGWVIIFKHAKQYKQQPLWLSMMMVILILLLVLPSLAFNGTAYFPRFQMFNFSACTLLFLFVIQAGLVKPNHKLWRS